LISSAQVERVVSDISSGAADPNHVATVVGGLMQRQGAIGHYVQGHARELSLEGTVMLLLHAAVLIRCVETAMGRDIPRLDFRALDRAARAENVEHIFVMQPALASYVDSNVVAEDPTLGGARLPVARRILAVLMNAILVP
jgi:hypothetical protein